MAAAAEVLAARLLVAFNPLPFPALGASASKVGSAQPPDLRRAMGGPWHAAGMQTLAVDRSRSDVTSVPPRR